VGSLHLVHTATALATCVDVATSGDVVVLIQDAVYAATDRERPRTRPDLRWHVLAAHVTERAIDDRVGDPEAVRRIDWTGVVDLVVACDRSITWV
jgi:sulfur relay protein TusB/DsrH